MAQTIADRVYALIYDALSLESDIEMAPERQRIAQAVVDKLRGGNIDFRLGPLALLADATVAEELCLCGADLGPPWDSIPHRKGTPGCRLAAQNDTEDS